MNKKQINLLKTYNNPGFSSIDNVYKNIMNNPDFIEYSKGLRDRLTIINVDIVNFLKENNLKIQYDFAIKNNFNKTNNTFNINIEPIIILIENKEIKKIEGNELYVEFQQKIYKMTLLDFTDLIFSK